MWDMSLRHNGAIKIQTEAMNYEVISGNRSGHARLSAIIIIKISEFMGGHNREVLTPGSNDKLKFIPRSKR